MRRSTTSETPPSPSCGPNRFTALHRTSTTSSSPPHQHDSSSLVCHRCCRQHGQDRTLDGTHPEAAEAPGTEDGLEAGTKGGNCGGINRRRQETEVKDPRLLTTSPCTPPDGLPVASHRGQRSPSSTYGGGDGGKGQLTGVQPGAQQPPDHGHPDAHPNRGDATRMPKKGRG